MGKYHYQIEKQETKTSGIVDLVKVKKTSSGGKKPSKVSTRDLLLGFIDEQRQFNKQVIVRLDNVDERLNNVEKHLNKHDLIFKRNNLK